MFRSMFYAFMMIASCWLPSLTGSLLLADLNKSQLKELETVFAPAYAMGNTPVILESLGKVVTRMTDEQLDELDDLFAQQGIPAPSSLLVTARLQLLQQGFGKKLKRPTPRERMLMLEHIDIVTSTLINNLDIHVDAVEKLSTDNTFDEFESSLWNSHVLGNRLRN